MATIKLPADTFAIGGEMPVNRMGFGTMRLTGDGIWGPPEDRAEAVRVLEKSVELGINFIDTADSYGPNISEQLISDTLFPYPDNLVIATKGGLTRTGPNEWHVNSHPDHLKKALEGSLERLKLDRIDLYQLHRVDKNVPIEQSLEFLQNAREEGLIRYIGLSEVSIDQIKKAGEYVKVASVQNKYSIDHRKWEAELQYCHDHSIAFIPWYPLGGGDLKAVEQVEKVAKKHGTTGYQIALSWLLHRDPNILVIPGTSKVKHLEENYKALTITLSDEDMEVLEMEVGS